MQALHKYWKTIRQLCGTIYWRELILCSPAILIVLAFSSHFSYIHAVIMIGAAFSVGFGASRSFQGYRWGAVSISTIGMALSAIMGSLFGHEGLYLYLIIAILTTGCAIFISYNNDLWWISLQIVIAFLSGKLLPRKSKQCTSKRRIYLAWWWLTIIRNDVKC